MDKLCVFLTCFDEKKAVEFLLQKLHEIYPNINVYIVSEKVDLTYLENNFNNLKFNLVEDTMSKTFEVTDQNFREEIHQNNIKKCALAVIERLKNCIECFDSEYILMMDPDTLVRGKLNIPEDVKLLGSRINVGFPKEIHEVLFSVEGSRVIDSWGATPAIFHTKTFIKAYNFIKENDYILNKLCQAFYAIFAHDVLLPLLFALIGEEETFNPDIIECNRNFNWENTSNPLVHQFKLYY
jgi:hypothetical protein